jgi:hypothetical protein
VGGDVPVDSETLLVTDFVNLKIKSLSLSKVLIEVECACVCSYMYKYLYLYYISKKIHAYMPCITLAVHISH